MPTAASVTIADGETTPVDHVFDPAIVDPEYSVWENRASSSMVGYEKLKFWIKRPKNGASYTRVRFLLEIPRLEVIGTDATTPSGYEPVPKVAHRNTCDMVFTFHMNSVEGERKNLRVLVKNLMTNAFAVAALEDFDGPY